MPLLIGSPSARVTIVEFADFQCPFCSKFAADIAAIQQSYPDDVKVIFRHFPLTHIHPLAMDAAKASECAADQGRFAAMHDVLYSQQDQVGNKEWLAFASDAGVADRDRFQICMAATSPAPAIEKDIEAGTRLGVSGTPTILIDGKRLDGIPERGWLIAEVERIRRRQKN